LSFKSLVEHQQPVLALQDQFFLVREAGAGLVVQAISVAVAARRTYARAIDALLPPVALSAGAPAAIDSTVRIGAIWSTFGANSGRARPQAGRPTGCAVGDCFVPAPGIGEAPILRAGIPVATVDGAMKALAGLWVALVLGTRIPVVAIGSRRYALALLAQHQPIAKIPVIKRQTILLGLAGEAKLHRAGCANAVDAIIPSSALISVVARVIIGDIQAAGGNVAQIFSAGISIAAIHADTRVLTDFFSPDVRDGVHVVPSLVILMTNYVPVPHPQVGHRDFMGQISCWRIQSSRSIPSTLICNRCCFACTPISRNGERLG